MVLGPDLFLRLSHVVGAFGRDVVLGFGSVPVLVGDSVLGLVDDRPLRIAGVVWTAAFFVCDL